MPRVFLLCASRLDPLIPPPCPSHVIHITLAFIFAHRTAPRSSLKTFFSPQLFVCTCSSCRTSLHLLAAPRDSRHLAALCVIIINNLLRPARRMSSLFLPKSDLNVALLVRPPALGSVAHASLQSHFSTPTDDFSHPYPARLTHPRTHPAQ